MSWQTSQRWNCGKSTLPPSNQIKGKAPGPENITIELIEMAGETIYTKLAALFKEYLRKSKFPEKWNEAIIILLYKKGDLKNISNYRPTSLLNNTRNFSPKSSRTE